MKRLLILFLATSLVLVISGCSDNSVNENKTNQDTNETQSEDVNNNSDNESKSENEKKKIYQVGETAKIISGLYDFPYEVTVNSFELIRKEKDGINPKELYGGELEPEESIAIANVTIKNISDMPFIPNEKISAQFLMEGKASQNSFDQFFTERNEELKPGEEITGNLAYFKMYDSNEDFQLVYEFKDKQETKFLLPNPSK
ncbi:DUF4352 domain-containing protein [Virgibacillus oceani]|uniref:DUF4352 domain-containing protein n=1 Tax=Virgibacillus oceani TaxID=1479511 RepID=A0A917LX28_9BACI|nr:DUF4352 domain-containing protein [Virgibacillus oceani]GGG62980.1 hypothetical protein GCM10011398_02960 [Virgibacillus oceani]